MPIKKVAKQVQATEPGKMPAKLPPTTDNALPTNESDQTLPVPPPVRDDVPDITAAASSSDPRPPGLELPLGAWPGNGDPREWLEGESRARPEMSFVSDSPAKDVTRVLAFPLKRRKTTLDRIHAKRKHAVDLDSHLKHYHMSPAQSKFRTFCL